MNKLAILEGRTEPYRRQPYNSIGPDETAAAVRVLESRNLSGFVGRAGDAFLGGPFVRQLEKEFCDFFGIKHAVTFNSATTVLQAAVAALGIGPGDEVITSPYTMSATASAILLNGAVPVFADIHPDSYCVDPESVRRNITPRTRAIIAVNIFGGSADYDELRKIADEHGLKIIEDNAQGPGGTYRGKYLATVGDIGVFSLNVHKVIQCGEGGVLVTNDDKLAYRAQLVRNHGEVILDDTQDFDEHIMGSNYRLSEVHAAIASVQFKKLDQFNQARIDQVAYLNEKLKQFAWLVPCRVPEHIKHVYYLYPFEFKSEVLGISRKTFAKAVVAEGFRVAEGYVKPIYLMPTYQNKRMFPRSQFPFVSTEYPNEVSYAKGICPTTERLFEKDLLTTTIHQPPNTREDVDAFCEVLKRIEAQVAELKEYESRNA